VQHRRSGLDIFGSSCGQGGEKEAKLKLRPNQLIWSRRAQLLLTVGKARDKRLVHDCRQNIG
jgi:hypothetical protein